MSCKNWGDLGQNLSSLFTKKGQFLGIEGKDKALFGQKRRFFKNRNKGPSR